MSEFVSAEIRDGIGRVYTIKQDDGSLVEYPSATTILKVLPDPPGLTWFKNNFPNAEEHTARRAMIGTTCHFFLESQCAKQVPEHVLELEKVKYAEYLDDKSLEAIGNINRKIESVLRQNDYQTISMEDVVYSHLLRVAGRVDWRGIWNGKRVILDLKTSPKFYDESKSEYEERLEYMEENDGKAPKGFTSKHALQLSLYKQAYKECFGWEAEELWILRVNEKNKPELRQMADILDDVMDVREMFELEYGM